MRCFCLFCFILSCKKKCLCFAVTCGCLRCIMALCPVPRRLWPHRESFLCTCCSKAYSLGTYVGDWLTFYPYYYSSVMGSHLYLFMSNIDHRYICRAGHARYSLSPTQPHTSPTLSAWPFQALSHDQCDTIYLPWTSPDPDQALDIPCALLSQQGTHHVTVSLIRLFLVGSYHFVVTR